MRRAIALALMLAPLPVSAQTIVNSAGPETVSLTVYRGQKYGNPPINKDWPTGYALITETRTVTIPAGESVVRFEGVAEGMFPESAIVSGLPKGVTEKNRDARLLSPQGLVDAYLKRQVTLVRTNKATGKVRKQEAFITAGPKGGVVLKTEDGYEALRCTGLPERMQFPGVPADLAAKPTLSVLTRSDREVTVTLTLTYMSAGFDWQANYVAQVQERKIAGDDLGTAKIDLFAWLTLANGGNQSFANANTMAIAGEPNRVRRKTQPRPTGGALYLDCWPDERTHEVPYRDGYENDYYPAYMPSPPPPPPPPMSAPPPMESIRVTGSRAKMAMPVAVVVAEQENLGDLKLYRIPEPVSVNAKGQKQVAMLVKSGAAFDHYYAATASYYAQSTPMAAMFRTDNLTEKGLGLPMPQGQMLVFEDSDYGPLLAGQTSLKDRAVGDEIELRVGSASDVRLKQTLLFNDDKQQQWKLEVSNARNSPIKIEIEIPYELKRTPTGVLKVDGIPTWKAIIPANGDSALVYEIDLTG